MRVQTQPDATAGIPIDPPTEADGTRDQRALPADRATLPIVDVSALLDGDEAARREVGRRLGRAARNSGFFYVANHGVPQDLMDAMFKASREFHSKPRAYKMRYWSGFTTNHRGYVPFEENGASFPKSINMNEAWDLSFEAPADHPDFRAGWRMTGPNVWPDLPGWRDTVSSYYDAVFALGLRMLDALAHELGVDPADLRRHITAPTSQLRMLRYVPNELPMSADVVGIDAHSDFECFTILLQGGPGLQVMNADDYWMEAPPVPGCFIVNIGDIFETWSGGEFRSTQHRVVNTGNERFSFPLFFGLDYHATVEPLTNRTPEVLAKYPPMKAGEHLMRMSVKAFRYMADAHEKGELTLDTELVESNPFKRAARVIEAA